MPNINAANISSARFAEQASNPSTPAADFASIFRKADGFYVIDENAVANMLVQAPDAATPQTIIQAASLTNTIIGDQVGDPGGTACTFLGQLAGANGGAGADNTFIGWEAGTAYTTGDSNVGVGADALWQLTEGSKNIAIGESALGELLTGNYNVAVGHNAGDGILGSNNVLIGHMAGLAATGSSNVFVGYQAGYSEAGSNKLYLANTSTATPLIYGEFDNAIVQINGKLVVDQLSTSAAVPVLTLDQADVSEEFVKFIGASAADNTQSLADAADLGTPGAIVGWVKVYVEDVAVAGAITDGLYWIPFYATPT